MIKRFIFLSLLLPLTACQSVFFFPSKVLVQTPTDFGLKYEDHFIEVSPEVRVHAWELVPKGDERGTILLLHGNAENISTHIMSVSWLVDYGYRVYAFDYEGFGRSEGVVSIENSIRDSRAVLKHILNNKVKKPVVVIGQSIGGAIGLYAYSEKEYSENIELFVVDSSFPSYRGVARERLEVMGLMPPFSNLVSLCASACCEPEEVIASYTKPQMLFIHDDLDPILSKKQSEILFKQVVSEKKELWKESEGKHIAFFNSMKNRERFLNLLGEIK